MKIATVIVVALVLAAVGRGVADKPAGQEVAKLVSGNNAFAFDLYARLRGGDGNLFFSPESISTALGMTYAGARGQTADQMAKALHFALPSEQLHAAFADLGKRLQAEASKSGDELSIANALWLQ